MNRYTCHVCRQPIPTGEAVLRGNGHRVLAFHRGDCYSVHAIATSTVEPLRPTVEASRVERAAVAR